MRFPDLPRASHDLTPADGLELVFELTDLAETLLRERLRREHPELSRGEVEARIDAWYLVRPGAEQGDGEGVPGQWPRAPKPQ